MDSAPSMNDHEAQELALAMERAADQAERKALASMDQTLDVLAAQPVERSQG